MKQSCLDPCELAAMEMHLRWIVVLRLFWMISVPLIICLLFDNWVAQALLWFLTIIIFWVAVGNWGHTIISLGVICACWYVFFEWDKAPDWLVYVFGAMSAFQIAFINHRVAQIGDLTFDEQVGSYDTATNELAEDKPKGLMVVKYPDRDGNLVCTNCGHPVEAYLRACPVCGVQFDN